MTFNEQLELTEKYNKQKVTELLCLGKEFINYIILAFRTNEKENTDVASETNTIYSLLEYIQKNDYSIKVKYKQGNKTYRNTAIGHSIQNINKIIKSYLFIDGYKDLDIVNCYCTILLHICEELHIDTPLIREYVFNREEILKKECIKKIDVISLLFGSKATSHYTKSLKKEINKVYETLKDTYKAEYTHAVEANKESKKHNILGTFFTLILPKEEANILKISK